MLDVFKLKAPRLLVDLPVSWCTIVRVESLKSTEATFSDDNLEFLQEGIQDQLGIFFPSINIENLEVLKEEGELDHFSVEAITLANKSLEHIAKAVKERVEEINKPPIH